MKTSFYLTAALMAVLASCKPSGNTFDASGSFETDETLISSEVSGTLLAFDVREGSLVQRGTLIGLIDTTQLYLKKVQLLAQQQAIASRTPNIEKQLASLDAQTAYARQEYKRTQALFAGGAATQKQVDDMRNQVEVLEKQAEALQSSLQINAGSINKERLPVEVQVAQLNDQLKKCRLVAPISGTVLATYAHTYETALPGKPLYKIGALDTLTLRVYITGDQLPKIALNQTVKVFTDNGSGGFDEAAGKVTWISDQAEFTPKTIQTKDERASMVYAVKVRVPNKGLYKIGMYGEIRL